VREQRGQQRWTPRRRYSNSRRAGLSGCIGGSLRIGSLAWIEVFYNTVKPVLAALAPDTWTCNETTGRCTSR
jgi:hypothetical protein